MPIQRLVWPICAFLALAGLILGYRAMTAGAEASVVVEWSTATELDTAGFNIYRSDSPDGPFTRVNEELIPASPNPLVGGSYSFTDTDVVAGQTYYYLLEDVETGGTTTRHGPIQVTAEGGTFTQGLLAAALIAVAVIGAAITGFTRVKTLKVFENL